MNKNKAGDKVLFLCAILLIGAICVDKMWDKHLKEPLRVIQQKESESCDAKVDKVQGDETLVNETETDDMNKGEEAKVSLFIGDSRTVGLQNYAGIENADFFAKTGMSVYSVNNEVLDVQSVGNISLKELLETKKYGKVYLMLGINELGYDFENTVLLYEELLEQIKNTQPDAEIFLQANLHVTKMRSDNDSVVNNDNINKFNDRVEQMADGEYVYYLDANTLFDDEEGNLAVDTNNDNTHLLSKCYPEWGEWIEEQTEVLQGRK